MKLNLLRCHTSFAVSQGTELTRTWLTWRNRRTLLESSESFSGVAHLSITPFTRHQGYILQLANTCKIFNLDMTSAMPPAALRKPDSLATFSTLLVRHEDRLSFLDLPPEIRILIYVAVTTISMTILPSGQSRRPLSSSSKLLRVNKQVRQEFKSVMFQLADIQTEVKNFDFR